MKTIAELHLMLAAATDEQTKTLLYHAIGATREYEARRDLLAEAIGQCRQMLINAARELDRGYRPNSLGILQGNGVAVDRLCGELDCACRAAEAAQELLGIAGIN